MGPQNPSLITKAPLLPCFAPSGLDFRYFIEGGGLSLEMPIDPNTLSPKPDRNPQRTWGDHSHEGLRDWSGLER